MTPELFDLARRAVACPKWKWVPGMLAATPPDAVWREIGADRVRVTSDWEAGGPCGAPSQALPDLTDPATLGCLLALVREAWGSNRCFVRRDPSWFMLCPTPPAETARIGHGWSGPFTGDTEAEALVAALEAAP